MPALRQSTPIYSPRSDQDEQSPHRKRRSPVTHAVFTGRMLTVGREGLGEYERRTQRDATGIYWLWHLGYPALPHIAKYAPIPGFTTLQPMDVRTEYFDLDLCFQYFRDRVGGVFEVYSPRKGRFTVIFLSMMMAKRCLHRFQQWPFLFHPVQSIKGGAVLNRRILYLTGRMFSLGNVVDMADGTGVGARGGPLTIRSFKHQLVRGPTLESPSMHTAMEAGLNPERDHKFFLEGISIVVDRAAKRIFITMPLAKSEGSLEEVTYRLVIPFSFLRHGKFIISSMGRKSDAKLPVFYIFRLRRAPLIYVSAPSIGRRSYPVARDFNRDNCVLGIGPEGPPRPAPHPLAALAYCDTIAIATTSRVGSRILELRDVIEYREVRHGRDPVKLIAAAENFEAQLMSKLNEFRRLRPQTRIHMALYALLANGYISDPHAVIAPNGLLDALIKARHYSDAYIFYALEKMATVGRAVAPISDPVGKLNFFLNEAKAVRHNEVPLGAQLSRVYHFDVTPFRIYIIGPYTELSNRVLRQNREVADRFVRVSYLEEDLTTLHARRTENKPLVERVTLIMSQSIYCFDPVHPYKLLGYSSSQMRSRSSWHLRDDDGGKTLRQILEDLGNFSSCDPRKIPARQGLLYSATRFIRELGVETTAEIPDETSIISSYDPEKGSFNFTDGVGFCSAELMAAVQKSMSLPEMPSAVQIRYRGYKGMLVVYDAWFQNTKLPPFPVTTGKKRLREEKKLHVVFRNSMHKFDSQNLAFEVVDYSRWLQFYFNRQIILTLDTLNVPGEVFLELQDKMSRAIESASESTEKAREFLLRHGEGFERMKLADRILSRGISVEEPFVSGVIDALKTYTLRYLFRRSRILSDDGANVFGVSDDTQKLKYDDGAGFPEVFFWPAMTEIGLSGPLNPSDRLSAPIRGHVFITKCPVLHPGDVQLCRAVDRPELHHCKNVLVFPQKRPADPLKIHPNHPGYPGFYYEGVYVTGCRDIPNMLSGSDLDGDQYHICWEPTIIKHLLIKFKKDRGLCKPAPWYIPLKDSSALDPTVRDPSQLLISAFTGSILNDQLGIIATNHQRFAHKTDLYDSGQKANSDQCLLLARLHSEAVDAPKTGKKINVPSNLKCRQYPHFKPPLDDRLDLYSPCEIFESKSLIGRLYSVLCGKERKIVAKQDRVCRLTTVRYVGVRRWRGAAPGADGRDPEDAEEPMEAGEVEEFAQAPDCFVFELAWEVPEHLCQSPIESIKIGIIESRDAAAQNVANSLSLCIEPHLRNYVVQIMKPARLEEELLYGSYARGGPGGQPSEIHYSFRIGLLRHNQFVSNESSLSDSCCVFRYDPSLLRRAAQSREDNGLPPPRASGGQLVCAILHLYGCEEGRLPDFTRALNDAFVSACPKVVDKEDQDWILEVRKAEADDTCEIIDKHASLSHYYGLGDADSISTKECELARSHRRVHIWFRTRSAFDCFVRWTGIRAFLTGVGDSPSTLTTCRPQFGVHAIRKPDSPGAPSILAPLETSYLLSTYPLAAFDFALMALMKSSNVVSISIPPPLRATPQEKLYSELVDLASTDARQGPRGRLSVCSTSLLLVEAHPLVRRQVMCFRANQLQRAMAAIFSIEQQGHPRCGHLICSSQEQRDLLVRRQAVHPTLAENVQLHLLGEQVSFKFSSRVETDDKCEETAKMELEVGLGSLKLLRAHRELRCYFCASDLSRSVHSAEEFEEYAASSLRGVIEQFLELSFDTRDSIELICIRDVGGIMKALEEPRPMGDDESHTTSGAHCDTPRQRRHASKEPIVIGEATLVVSRPELALKLYSQCFLFFDYIARFDEGYTSARPKLVDPTTEQPKLGNESRNEALLRAWTRCIEGREKRGRKGRSWLVCKALTLYDLGLSVDDEAAEAQTLLEDLEALTLEERPAWSRPSTPETTSSASSTTEALTERASEMGRMPSNVRYPEEAMFPYILSGETISRPLEFCPEMPLKHRHAYSFLLSNDAHLVSTAFYGRKTFDLDLVHRNFWRYLDEVERLYVAYTSQLMHLLNEHAQYDEIEAITGCVLGIDDQFRAERELKERLMHACGELRNNLKHRIEEYFRTMSPHAQRAMASAAYVYSHKRRLKAVKDSYAVMDIYGRIRNVVPEARVEDKSDEESADEETHPLAKFEGEEAPLRFSVSFPWIGFIDELLQLKTDCREAEETLIREQKRLTPASRKRAPIDYLLP